MTSSEILCRGKHTRLHHFINQAPPSGALQHRPHAAQTLPTTPAHLSCMQAAYIRVPAMARQAVREAGYGWREGLHAASHAMLNCVPLHLMCDAADMGTECDNPYDSRFRPERLLLYDKHPGGIGLAAQVRHQPDTSFLCPACAYGAVMGCHAAASTTLPSCSDPMPNSREICAAAEWMVVCLMPIRVFAPGCMVMASSHPHPAATQQPHA